MPTIGKAGLELNQELNPELPWRWQGPNYLSYHPRYVLEGIWNHVLNSSTPMWDVTIQFVAYPVG